MGMPGPFRSSCKSSPYAVQGSNPNPELFKVLMEHYQNGFLVLLVEYDGCTNYEGKKLLVYQGFKNSHELILHNFGRLDPHFDNRNRRSSPIARFRPEQASIDLIDKMIR